jgi:defect-in-organelle-trafficking protein DotB
MNGIHEARLVSDPIRYDQGSLDSLLKTLVEAGAGDVMMISESPVRCFVGGRWKTVGQRTLKTPELADLMNAIDMGNSSSRVQAGESRNFAYEISLGERTERARFRVNGSSVRRSGNRDIKIVMRAIPDTPPRLSDMGLPEELLRHLFPMDGLVGVAGVTGSGKSTLLAAALREKLEQGGCHIATAEAPIEFVYDKVETRNTGIIAQSEVPTHHPTFGKAVEEMLRQKPDAILVGEARDAETIANTILACQTGHATYTTTHTNGVSETISRMSEAFPGPERDSAASKLLATLRVLIHQRLVPKADGSGRTPIREWLVFDREIKKRLFGVPMIRWSQEISEILDDRKQSAVWDARRLFASGTIGRDILDVLEGGG